MAIAKILATAPTDEEQRNRLEALDGKKPSVAQEKPVEKKKEVKEQPPLKPSKLAKQVKELHDQAQKAPLKEGKLEG